MDSITFTLLAAIFREASSTYSIGAFFAFIIIANGAILGILSLKSHVITAGPVIFKVSSPVSTYLVTLIYFPFIYTLEAKVA